MPLAPDSVAAHRAALQHQDIPPPVQAVIFDAFGTLLQIRQGRHPYRQLLKLGIAQGRRPHPADIQVLMTRPLSLAGAAAHFGIQLEAEHLLALEAELAEEVAGIEPFEEALAAVDLLQNAGIRLAVCSNLAEPYGAAVHRWFPQMDAYALSYAVGAMKPEPAIYRHACEQLGAGPAAVAMIGDSQRCDRDGPQQYGMQGYYLDRTGGAGACADLLTFAERLLAR
ncbi:HAD family hydrolase [Geopseudomonas aromaticivorans]